MKCLCVCVCKILFILHCITNTFRDNVVYIAFYASKVIQVKKLSFISYFIRLVVKCYFIQLVVKFDKNDINETIILLSMLAFKNFRLVLSFSLAN